jgi:N utilization substance protein B
MRSKSRRQAREAALQALYTMDIGRGRLAETIKQTLEQTGLDGDLAEFARTLISGVFEKQTALDELIEPLVTDWNFERIAVVDRNVLRLAAFELYHCPDIPPISTINEAIEMAKKYSTVESGKFVNGILGKLLPMSPKADWDPAAHPAYVRAALDEEETPQEEQNEPSAAPEESSAVSLWKLRSEGEEAEAGDVLEEPR